MATLLVVDDTVETCRMLAKLFQKRGHVTESLYGGSDVVRLMNTVRFDLVLLDVMMPDVDGFTVLKAIRSDPVVGATPVAMYSAVSDAAAQQRALDLGANEWIVKGTPFALVEHRIDGLLRQP